MFADGKCKSTEDVAKPVTPFTLLQQVSFIQLIQLLLGRGAELNEVLHHLLFVLDAAVLDEVDGIELVLECADLDIQGEPCAIEFDDKLDGLLVFGHQFHELQFLDVIVVQLLHFESDFVGDLQLGRIAREHYPILGLRDLNGYFRHGGLSFLADVRSFAR